MKPDETYIELVNLKDEYSKLKTAFELRGDFMEWIIDTQLPHTNSSELWELFENQQNISNP